MTKTQQLSPEDALKHLDDVASKYQGTRQDHALLQFSSQILRATISEWRALKEKEILFERAQAETKTPEPENEVEAQVHELKPTKKKGSKKAKR